MIPVLSRAQMRAFDRYAIEVFHVPGAILMENAGRGAADVISALIEELQRSRALGSSKAHGPSHGLSPFSAQALGILNSPSRGSASAGVQPPSVHGLNMHVDTREQRRAAEHLASRARQFPVRHVPSPGQPAHYPLNARVVVVCGSGLNGGDGFVVARHLLARGADVEVFLTGSSEKVTGESRVNHDAFIDLGGKFTELPFHALLRPLSDALATADILVDALFGTGLNRVVEGYLAEVIRVMNASRCHCVALDIPSGLDADSGEPMGIAVQADDTVTFGHLKIGLLTPEGARLAGNVHVVDLGVPDGPILAHVGHVAEVLRTETVGSHIVTRQANTHKHRAGNVLVVAGSLGKLGASLLTARAALRAGAGLVTVCTWPDAALSLDSRILEIMSSRIELDRIESSLDEALLGKRAVAIGPGLGLDEKARRAVDHVVLHWDGLKVVDADALTHFVGRIEQLAQARGSLVLTPHPGELGRLLGRSAHAIEQDRFGAVREAVERSKSTVVLKGARTIIALPDGRMFICMAGNPVLATAGSGDVLTGIVAAFACGMTADRAACAGVLVHALSGDSWRARTGSDRGLLAGEIADEVPQILAMLGRGNEEAELGE